MSTQIGSEPPETANPQLQAPNSDLTEADATFPDNSIKNKIQDKAESLRARMTRTADWFDERFKELTFSQYCYFFAMFLLLGFTFDEASTDDFLVVVGAIAGLGLIRELWIVFNKIWEHALGKALLLVLYAATANFALAISALKINSIAGVEPQIFIFTMGFTTLLMMPFWLLGASFVFLCLAIIAINVWLLISFVLRIIRIKIKIHWEDQSFAVLTMLMRVVLIPVLIYALGILLQPYLKQLDMLDHFQEATLIEKMEPELAQVRLIDPTPFKGRSKEEITDFLQMLKAADIDNLSNEEMDAMQEYKLDIIELGIISGLSDRNLTRLIERLHDDSDEEKGVTFRTSFSTDTDLALNDSQSDEASATQTQNSGTAATEGTLSADASSEAQTAEEANPEEIVPEEEVPEFLNLMVANFLYLFETYRYTACAKEPHQRGLQLDENMLFIAERDTSTELGFRFFVTACVPNEKAR